MSLHDRHRCETHPEEQVEEEEKILDAVVDRHRDSVSCEIKHKLESSNSISLFYLFWVLLRSDWPTCCAGAGLLLQNEWGTIMCACVCVCLSLSVWGGSKTCLAYCYKVLTLLRSPICGKYGVFLPPWCNTAGLATPPPPAHLPGCSPPSPITGRFVGHLRAKTAWWEELHAQNIVICE